MKCRSGKPVLGLALILLSCARPGPEAGLPAESGPPPYTPPTGADDPRAEWVGEACGYWPVDREPADIDLVVIHTCQMGFYECWSYLHSCHERSSSAHYVVSSAGEVVQMVADRHIAWHATCVNPWSIGIEHEGWVEEPQVWYTDAMYCASAAVVRRIADLHAIPLDREHIISHLEANQRYCGGTHHDPGPGWDWDWYMKLVREGCEPCMPGEHRCPADGTAVERCDPSGMTWSTVFDCPCGCSGGRCPCPADGEGNG